MDICKNRTWADLSFILPKSKRRKNKNIFICLQNCRNKPYVLMSYIKIFSIMNFNTKINIIGILCIVFYYYLILIRYYSKLVKFGGKNLPISNEVFISVLKVIDVLCFLFVSLDIIIIWNVFVFVADNFIFYKLKSVADNATKVSKPMK